MAQSKYADLDKDALVAAVKERRAAGRKIVVDLRHVDKIVDALDADDMENGDFALDSSEATEEATELTPKDLSLGAVARADGVQTREVPDDLDDYAGEYRYLVGEPIEDEFFGLKVLPDDQVRAHKTHTAKSPFRFWDGTKEQFRLQFEKV